MDEDEDRQRFTRLYDAYRPRVWAYAASRVGSQVADEVVSETFVVAWRRFVDVPDAALPWLLGVARNVIRDSIRAQTRRDSLAAELRTWTEKSESDIADTVVDQLAARSALSRLSEADREVLLLATWQDLTTREAAQVLGCSATAVRVRLHRARKRFVAALNSSSSPQAYPTVNALELS